MQVLVSPFFKWYRAQVLMIPFQLLTSKLMAVHWFSGKLKINFIQLKHCRFCSFSKHFFLLISFFFSPGLSQQEWRSELQQSGQPGEGLRGQIQACPQKMRCLKLPADQTQLLKVQFPSRWIEAPGRRDPVFFWYLYLFLNDDQDFFFSIEFHILLEKKKYPIRNCNARALYFA